MRNEIAYQTKGFEDWLEKYKYNLEKDLYNDIYVRSGACRMALKQYDVKTMKTQGMSETDIIDYVRLHRGWQVGAYDGAFLSFGDEYFADKEFNLMDNETHPDNLKALRFVVFLDEKHRNLSTPNKPTR